MTYKYFCHWHTLCEVPSSTALWEVANGNQDRQRIRKRQQPIVIGRPWLCQRRRGNGRMALDHASDARGVTGIAMFVYPLQFFLTRLGAGSLVNRESQMKHIVSSWEVLRRQGQRFGPYLLLEAVMPGGTLFAFLLYLYRVRRC